MSKRLFESLGRVALSLLVCVLYSTSAQSAASAQSDPNQPLVVLYDQTDFPTASPIRSVDYYNYGLFGDSQDNKAADDFIVPAGKIWTISQIEVVGTYANVLSPSVTAVNVYIYSSGFSTPVISTTINAPAAGRAVYSYTNVSLVGGATTGNFVINLPALTFLGPGTYWLSVQGQVNGNVNPIEWRWTQRSVQYNHKATWISNSFVELNCNVVWNTADACSGSNLPDLLFKLTGTEAPAIPIYLPLIRR